MPTNRLLAALLTVTLAAACDQGDADSRPSDGAGAKLDKKTDDPAQKPAQKPAEKPAEKPQAEQVLALGDAKIHPKGQPEKAVMLTADGTVKLVDAAEARDAWKLTTDGKLSKTDGTVLAQVGADGAVKIAGRNSGIVLDDTGLTLSSPNGKTVTMKFGDDGVVQMQPPPAPGMQMVSEGCKPPVAKSCALVLAIYLLAADGSPNNQ